MLRAYGATDKGRVRSINEDHFVVDERLQLLVVADGMGGHNAGEVASHLAVDAISEFVEHSDEGWPFGFDPTLSTPGNVLRTAIHFANMRVLEMAGTTEEYSGMGTTVVAVLLTGDTLSVAHVGDSRLYVITGRRIRQVTHDDSWMASMLAANPTTDPLMFQHHPMRNALTNVIGARPGIDVHIGEEKLAGGEWLLLTTDGVHGVMDEGSLERLVRDEKHLAKAAAAVVGAALARGSRDNCTVIVARYAAA